MPLLDRLYTSGVISIEMLSCLEWRTPTHKQHAEGVWDATEGQLSLPGSPQWTEDMNPGRQPDGEFSRLKRARFARCVSVMLRRSRSSRGMSRFEALVLHKRRKHQVEMILV
eukprot:TRINITY_DN3040_c0_g2_i3.p2 TRINITY_DN3040_c0_g2~~TRINITY_DN3040_c0_g2_i3.p2  ORF type:complete len:112 (-),score=23.47 TRINITY_DN3040_c0_g2_i3:52-387(-)